MMNNWLLLLLFLLIPQFLIEVLLLHLLLLVQLHNVSRIHRDSNKLFSSQVKKPVISQTGRSKIGSDHQSPQEVCHRENPKQGLAVVLGHDALKKLGALGFGGLIYFFFKLTGVAMYQKLPKPNNKAIEAGPVLY